jgi:hypothetical protein
VSVAVPVGPVEVGPVRVGVGVGASVTVKVSLSSRMVMTPVAASFARMTATPGATASTLLLLFGSVPVCATAGLLEM